MIIFLVTSTQAPVLLRPVKPGLSDLKWLDLVVVGPDSNRLKRPTLLEVASSVRINVGGGLVSVQSRRNLLSCSSMYISYLTAAFGVADFDDAV